MNKSLIKEIEELSKSPLAIRKISSIADNKRARILKEFNLSDENSINSGDVGQILLALVNYLKTN